MTHPSSAVDFFAIEAGEYLDQLDVLVASAGPDLAPDAQALARTTRALRGAATMARQAPLAELAAAMEAVAGAVRASPASWGAPTTDALVAAIDAYRALLRQVRAWDAAADARAAQRTSELRAAISVAETAPARSAGIVPIARLFHDDAGPHVVHRNPQPAITADQRFRQAAVPLASTLRRLIAEARHAVDDGARRTVGDDLRAALRDLGELAESYDIAPVTNFARVREAPLGRLDERALEVVDGAAQALVESAGTAWARTTPPSAVTAIEPPAPSPASAATAAEAPVAPATPLSRTPAPSSHAPASGQALVALLEMSITGLHQFGTDGELPEPAAPAPTAPLVDGVVSIHALEYRGRAALDRAREVRDLLRASPTPDPDLLSELYDLLDLAVDEPVHA